MNNNAYEVVKLDGGAWRIEDGVVRVFLFEGEEKALLVDSGFGGGDLRGLVASLTERPVMLVNTHADHDHFGGNGQFPKAYLHERELSRYRAEAGPELLAEALPESGVIDLGGLRFEVVLTPGHTPGSIALLDEENRRLIAGDSIQTGTVFMAGEGRDMRAYISSLRLLEGMRGSFDLVYPSHGPFPVGAELIPELIRGAEAAMRGEIPGSEAPPPFHDIAKIYDIGAAKLVF